MRILPQVPFRPKVYAWPLMIFGSLLLHLVTLEVANAQTYQKLHDFTGARDGAAPLAGITLDHAGNLYGTTSAGGGGTCSSFDLNGCGNVFKLTRVGTNWIFNPLYVFTGGLDGAAPNATVIFGPDGAIYGSTTAGGQGNCDVFGIRGCGVLFRLTPSSTFCRTVSCSWNETVLHGFTGSDGAYPIGDLTFGADENLYGTTEFGGGSGHCSGGCGVAFQLDHTGGTWTENLLYSFTGATDGGEPVAGLTFDSSGRLDGTTFTGGNLNACGSGCGTVFQLTKSGSAWLESVLYSFRGAEDGGNPITGVVLDQVGDIFGATPGGGTGGGGVIFQLSSSGSGFTLQVLQPLTGSQGPSGDRLLRDAAGNLYGTTFADGLNGLGSVFKLSQLPNGTWMYSTLHDFGGSDGANPASGLAMDRNGSLYGTTYAGGINGLGVVFTIAP